MTVKFVVPLRSVLLPVFLCVALTGCELVGNEVEAELQCLTQPIPGVLQPLDIGNRWEYERPDVFGQEFPNLIYEVTGKLDQTDESGNELFVMSVYSNGEAPSPGSRIRTNTSDGFENAGYIHEQDTLVATSVTYPYPATVGHIFQSFSAERDSDDGSIILTENREYEVLAVNHTTSVPMGKLETIVYEAKRYSSPVSDLATGPFLIHFAPGVGLVARDIGSAGGSLEASRRSLQLVDYCLMQ